MGKPVQLYAQNEKLQTVPICPKCDKANNVTYRGKAMKGSLWECSYCACIFSAKRWAVQS